MYTLLIGMLTGGIVGLTISHLYYRSVWSREIEGLERWAKRLGGIVSSDADIEQRVDLELDGEKR